MSMPGHVTFLYPTLFLSGLAAGRSFVERFRALLARMATADRSLTVRPPPVPWARCCRVS